MFRLKPPRFAGDETDAPALLTDSAEALQARVEGLTGDERYIYQWLRECYSERWIMETLLISKTRYRELSASLCRKLGVANTRAMLRIYGQLDAPKDRCVRTQEIDAYIETRTEQEIQAALRQKEGG